MLQLTSRRNLREQDKAPGGIIYTIYISLLVTEHLSSQDQEYREKGN